MKRIGVLMCVTAAAMLGCSISDSSESISDSISSPSESISDSSKSSSGGDAETAYRDDVSDHTRTVVAGGGSADDVTDDLGPVARQHGITDWEARDATWVGMGRGLALAGIESADLAAYEHSLGGDSHRIALLRRGFDSAGAARQ